VLLEVAKVNTETEQFLEDITTHNNNNNNREESSALSHEELSTSTRANTAREECTVPAAAPVAVNVGGTDDHHPIAENIPSVPSNAEVKLSAKDRLKLRVSNRKSPVQPLEEITTRTESPGTTAPPPSSSSSSSSSSSGEALASISNDSGRPEALVQQQLAVKASNEPLSVPESFLLGTIPMKMMVQHEDLHHRNADVDYGIKSFGSSSTSVDVRREVLQPQIAHDEVVPQTSTHDEVVPQTSTHDEVVPQTRTHDEVVPQTSTHDEVLPQTSTHDEVVPQTSTHDEVVPLVESKMMTAKERLLARMAKNKK
jgi:hypothetical protein